MQLFKTSRAYAFAFCLYALNTWYVWVRPLNIRPIAPLFISYALFTNVFGGLLCAGVLLAGIRKTSIAVEKAVLILSAIFFALFATDSLYQVGYISVVVPFRRYIYVAIICVATILTGVRLLKVATHQHKRIESDG
ncbi:MAG: hypothetical protein ACYDC6_14440 [Acidobacteriaceae bacterium]